MCIFAPTETGKTLLAIHMACGLLREGRRVLYCGNEDPVRQLLIRFHNNLSGMTKAELIDNPTLGHQMAVEAGYNNLVMLDMAPGSLSEIRQSVEKHKPDVVFIDQMANMHSSIEGKTEKNEYLSVQLRGMAKKYNLVTVILHQASDNAFGKLCLEKNDMYYSNVGMPGQMDVLLGFGMNAEFEMTDQRMITICKNKISGNHESFAVKINPTQSKVIEE